MSDRFWVTYRVTHDKLTKLGMRTGFLDSATHATVVAKELAEFDHVSEVRVEKISTLLEIKP